MSDPIAAAEAAGKARDIANRFETAVFLIAYGIAEKDGLYEADPHRYPYSQAFRHGMNILAALCAPTMRKSCCRRSMSPISSGTAQRQTCASGRPGGATSAGKPSKGAGPSRSGPWRQ